MREEIRSWFRQLEVHAHTHGPQISPDSEEGWKRSLDDIEKHFSHVLKSVSGRESVFGVELEELVMGMIAVFTLCPVPIAHLPTLRFTVETSAPPYECIQIIPSSQKSRFPGATVGEVVKAFIELVDEKSKIVP